MNNERSQQTCKQAFEAIFQEYADVVYRLCLYKTSDAQVAHDLTQETFLRLWKSMTAARVLENPKAYMYQIARNLIIDHYKARKSVSLDTLEEQGFEPVAHDASPALLADVALLRDAIESLEQDFRDVMYMRYIEEMAVQEIAAVLSISENLASVRINRGKKKLQELFQYYA